MGHTFSRILLHVIFSTKGRENCLYPAMREERLRYTNRAMPFTWRQTLSWPRWMAS